MILCESGCQYFNSRSFAGSHVIEVLPVKTTDLVSFGMGSREFGDQNNSVSLFFTI